MVGKEMSLSSPVSRRKLSSAATASISLSLPRGARAGNLDLVLHGLHQRDGAGRARDLAAVAGDETRERVRRGRLIEPHGLLLPAERSERAHEIGGLAHIGEDLRRLRTSFES